MNGRSLGKGKEACRLLAHKVGEMGCSLLFVPHIALSRQLSGVYPVSACLLLCMVSVPETAPRRGSNTTPPSSLCLRITPIPHVILPALPAFSSSAPLHRTSNVPDLYLYLHTHAQKVTSAVVFSCPTTVRGSSKHLGLKTVGRTRTSVY